jgi:hypothetical protein
MMNWRDAPRVSRWLLIVLSTRSQICAWPLQKVNMRREASIRASCQLICYGTVPMAEATSILETSLRRL